MNWINGNSGSSVICNIALSIQEYIIKCVGCIVNKRFYFNIIVILISVGLISGYYFSINDKEYWTSTFKTVTKETKAKVNLMGNTFVANTQSKFDTSIQLAYNNSKNAIEKKSFHQLPKIHIRSKTSIIETFTKKSFNTIDDSKKLRWRELKWKFFSKIQ
jgi:hypothetical protein